MKNDLTKIVDEDIIIEVAFLCGECGKRVDGLPFDLGLGPKTVLDTNKLPNYTQDLNACHEMEKCIPNDKVKTYQSYLWETTDSIEGGWLMIHSTARERCEAFILTMRT